VTIDKKKQKSSAAEVLGNADKNHIDNR